MLRCLGRPKVEKMADGESKQTSVTKTESNGISANSQTINNETSTVASEGVRELSLTDHLNKRLLDSFLQRLNDSHPDASGSSANDNADFDDDKPQAN